ncbi:MAG TPA: copper homeostasis protein CutC, partial [Candidatus Acidoferrum sp.]
SVDSMSAVRAALQIPVFAMIRPRAGNFVYDQDEFTTMKRDLQAAQAAGMDGVVLGILRADGTVDVSRTRELVDLVKPLQVTFHRAFDECTDLEQALEAVVSTGATRILTSGGAPAAADGALSLKKLVQAAGDRMTVMPGGGLHAANLAAVRAVTGAREFHSGLGSLLPYGGGDYSRFEEEVRAMAKQKSAH